MQRLNALSLYTYTGMVTPHRQELIAERLIHLSAEGKWKKKHDISLHKDCKALWESHSPKRHICDNLNQNLVVQSTSFKLGLFLQKADVKVNFWLLTDFKFFISFFFFLNDKSPSGAG